MTSFSGSSSRSTINCSEFSQSEIPNLKEMDHYMFVEYNGQGHFHPQRVSSARSRNVASLKLTYFTTDHLSYLKNSSEHLNLLDLSGSNLFKIPSELISGLTRLQIIILNNNQLSDSSFCKDFGAILGKSLKEISMCNNRLTGLIANPDSFTKLVRYKASNNAISNLKGIEKLKRLKLLMLENNEISQVGSGFYVAKRLENVYLSNNKVFSLSVAVRNLIHLREIDLSFNSIKVVPGELFVLPKLEILKLTNNKINQIPKFKIIPRLHNPITLVDLSYNNIVRFPDSVMRITEDLDLSHNKIKTVPSSILKKISYQSNQKLQLNHNPIIDPPKEICESGLKAMIQYYEEFEGTEAKYYGIKIFCFGGNGSAKNRLVNVLSDQSEEDDLQEAGIEVLEVYDTTSKNLNPKANDPISFNVKISNMSVELHYFDILIFFLTSPALNLIFVDIDDWKDEDFDLTIVRWLKNALSKRNEIIFAVVCMTNHVIDDLVQRKCENIHERVNGVFTDYMDGISERIRDIESKEKITASMSQSLKKMIQLKSITFSAEKNVICVNTKDQKSIRRMTNQISALITNKNIFPNVGTQVPSFWSDVQSYIEDECYEFPIISFSEFESLLQQKFNLKPAVLQVAKYLHEIGAILWWEDSLEPLNQWVITSPQVLLECCRLLMQPDLKSYLEDPNDPNTNIKRFKKTFPHSRLGFKGSCEILVSQGVLLPDLASILFENLLPPAYIGKMLFYLCRCWNLGYITQYPGFYCQDWVINTGEIRDNVSDVTSSVVSQDLGRISVDLKSRESRRSFESKNTQIPPLFLAILCRKTECSRDSSNEWQRHYDHRITICYRFPMGYPRLIFHQATVRVNDQTRFNVVLMDHWADGFQGRIRDENILFRIQAYSLGGAENIIQYEFQYGDPDKESGSEIDHGFRVSEIWKWAHGILTDMDSLLNSYQGLWFERFVKCPHCGELSFPGTWHSYNDNDSTQNIICSQCQKSVPIYRLEPPRISKNVSSEEIIRNIRKQFERQ